MSDQKPLFVSHRNDFNETFGVQLALTAGLKGEQLRSFLLNLKSLGIKKLFLVASLPTLERLFKEELTLITLFKDFQVTILFQPDFTHFFTSDPEKNRKFLLKTLFCNAQYFKRHQILGFPVFYFWGEQPEIYPLQNSSDLFALTIPKPEDVDALFLIKQTENGNLDAQVEDITTFFDFDNGSFKPFDLAPQSFALVVLRGYYFSMAGKTSQFTINYLDSSAMAALQKHYKQNLNRLPIHFQAVCYPLDEMFDVTQTVNKVNYAATLENVLNGIKKTIAYYYFNATRSVDNFFLKIVFKRFFNSLLRTRLEIIAPAVHYLLNADSPLVDIMPLDRQFLLTVDMERFHLNTPYFWQSFAAIRQMASAGFANNQSEVSVLCASLLLPGSSYVQQKYYCDLLLQAGASRFWLDTGLLDSNNILDYDFFSAQLDYFTQVVNFLNKGIPTANILMLIPALDQEKDIFYQSVEILSRAGIQFELIGFDAFTNSNLCKIENDHLLFNQKSFNLIILPGIRTIPYRALKKLYLFFKQGGHLAALGKLPFRVELKEKQQKFKKLKHHLWLEERNSKSISFIQDESGGKSYFIPRLSELNSFLEFYLQKDKIFVEGHDVLIRARETQHAVFVFLTNISDEIENRFVLKSQFVAQPFWWDFNEQKQKAVHYWNVYEDSMEIPLILTPLESRLMIIPKQPTEATNWHVSFCNHPEVRVEVPEAGTFVIGLPQDKLGPVDLVIENQHEQFSHILMITEQHLPLILPEDHWILKLGKTQKVIHLKDLESILTPDVEQITLRNTFMLKQFRPDFTYLLDLGPLLHKCFVLINGKAVGEKWQPPFHFDISAHLQAGENEIEITLKRTKGKPNDVLTPVSGYRFPEPLQIRPYKKFVIKTPT